MMVMPSNHSSPIVHYWAGKYPGRIGWLIGPSAMPKKKFRKWLPFALDNDAFTAWTKKQAWDEAAWRQMLLDVRLSGFAPLWVLCPDAVADKEATLEKWELFAPVVAEFNWQLAFAVQDGMTPADVPEGAEVVFVGGTTEWKWRTVKIWASRFPRVHVGRVNHTLEKLWLCESLGIESVDGSGWFRATDDGIQAKRLEMWIEGHQDDQLELDCSTFNNLSE